MIDPGAASAASAASAAITGATHGVTLIVRIGAKNAFVLCRGLRQEHVGANVALCALADTVPMLAGVADLAQVLGQRPRPLLAFWLTLGGASFLLLYVCARCGARPGTLQAADGQCSITLAQALRQSAAFTLLYPHVYLDTVLLLGSVGVQMGQARWWFTAGAALSSVLWFTALGYGARWPAPVFARPRAWHVLDGLIGVVMLGLAALLVGRL